MKKERDSGIELLRVLAIMMVIGVHVLLYGEFFNSADAVGGAVETCATLFKISLRPAVNIFIIITGFFMVKQQFNLKKSYKRLFSLWLTILFYSVVLSVITVLLGEDFHTYDGEYVQIHIVLLKGLFPVLSKQWYFFSHYILLCALIPFINITLQKITKRQYKILLAVLTLILSLWYTLENLAFFEEFISTKGMTDGFEGKNVFSFIYIYILGGYIGLFAKPKPKPQARWIVFGLLSVAVGYILLEYFNEQLLYENVAFLYTNPLVIFATVAALMFFKDLHFKSKTINVLGSTTLGVYAIHEFKFIRQFLWSKFSFDNFDCSNLFIDFVVILGTISIVFLGCAAIELLRQLLFRAIGKAVAKIKSKSTLEK